MASTGWQITWNQLARSLNDSANGLLLTLIDSTDQTIAQGAMEALLQRRCQTGPRELLRRWHTLDASLKRLVQSGSSQLLGALRDAVMSNDDQIVQNACQAACDLREYDLIAPLIQIAEDTTNTHNNLAANTVLHLSRQLFEETTGLRDYSKHSDPQMIRYRLLASLEKSVNRFRQHNRQEIVEAFIALATQDNGTLTRLLTNPHDAAYLCLINILTTSLQPSVIQLLLDFQDNNHLPLSVVKVIARRSDEHFVTRWLEQVQSTFSKSLRANIKRMENIHWTTNHKLLEKLEAPLQAAAIQLVNTSGMPRAEVLAFLSQMLDRGKTAGRAAAAEVLAEFNGNDANRLTLRSLSDPSPEVQAHGVRQIRCRSIPGALSRLLEFVESPHEIVREAARNCLPEFRFDRYLASFDILNDEVRNTTGKLVHQVDHEAHPKLVKELTAPTRSRRLRGLQMAQAMEVVKHVEDEVIELLQNDDHMVRTEAARTLALATSSQANMALQQALLDRSVAVQESASEALQRKGLQSSMQEPVG